MNQHHRNLIQRFTPRLVAEISNHNFDLLLQALARERVIFPEHVNFIRSKDGYERQKLEFFDLIQLRGPDAFNEFLLRLREVGEKDLCHLFKIKIFREESENEETAMTDDNEECYDLSSTPVGLMLLVNIDEYDNNLFSERPGSSSDEAKVVGLWKSLGFDVELLKNPDKEKFQSKLKQLQSKFHESTLSSVVVYIMSSCPLNSSNTKEIYITTRDAKNITAQRVFDFFKAKEAPGLIGKPKLFFFERFMRPGGFVTSHLDSGNPSEGVLMLNGSSVTPNAADIFYVSALHSVTTASGSDFVSAMCDIFPEGRSRLDIVSLINKVSNTVTHECDIMKEKRGFDKKFYL